MNNELTENEVLQQLDIPDWRHMTKDKIIEFTSSMQYMSPEVAKKALEQFPDFSKLGSSMVTTLKETLEIINSENNKSVSEAYAINMRILDNLEKELNKKFILPRQREKIIESMLQVSKNMSELDTQNKYFLNGNLKIVSTTIAAVFSVAGSILGSNILKRK